MKRPKRLGLFQNDVQTCEVPLLINLFSSTSECRPIPYFPFLSLYNDPHRQWMPSGHLFQGLRILLLLSFGRHVFILYIHLSMHCLAIWPAHLRFSCATRLFTSINFIFIVIPPFEKLSRKLISSMALSIARCVRIY